MDIETRNNFEKDATELCDKYGMKHVIISGDRDGQFECFFGLNNENIIDYFQTLLNAPRIYQSAREKVLISMNRIANERP